MGTGDKYIFNPTPELVKQYESEQIDREEEMRKWGTFVDQADDDKRWSSSYISGKYRFFK